MACLLALLAPVVRSQTSGKKKVSSQSDLPRFTYALTGSASDLVQADATTFNAFSAKVKADLDSIFRDYDIEDRATLRSLLSARVSLQQGAGENQLALVRQARAQTDFSGGMVQRIEVSCGKSL
jgi:hypothetical protein